MASAKKKLDEYHLKVLRQLVTQPDNKECFDCNQRGPTYVNVTIGSFVCTSCSGILRGLTPPHRVKSISMATFTPEEVDFIKARGNEYCRRIWLGLCDSSWVQKSKDLQPLKDFMISKYEWKRYYVDPAIASTLNGNTSNGNISPVGKPSTPSVQLKTQSSTTTKTSHTAAVIPPSSLAFTRTPSSQVNNINAFTPEPSFSADFSNLANTTPSDPFSSSSQFAATPANQQSFANFDNNPIFNNSSAPEVESCSQSSSSLPPMLFPMLNVPMRAMSAKSNRIPTNRWSIAGTGETGSVPGEDRYAALKDLDSLMKSQQQQQTAEPQPPAPDWNNGVSNVWQVPSAFNTPVPSVDNNVTSNPFKGENAWTNGNTLGANPFRSSRPTEVLWPVVANGQIPNGFPTSQSLNFAPSKLPWNSEAISNPFVLGNTQPTTGHHSSNPFL